MANSSPMQQTQEIIIFADGACIKNPGGPGGWGAIVAFDSKVLELGGHEPSTTNNRMEMESAIAGLAAVPDHATGQVKVFSDSKYVIDGITKWVVGWKLKGWMTKEKEPVKNRELWERLDALHSRFVGRIQWSHVPSHRGVPGNERADEIASTFARKSVPDLFNGEHAAYGIDLASLEPQFAKKNVRYESPPAKFDPATYFLGDAPEESKLAELHRQARQLDHLKTEFRTLQEERDMWRRRAQEAEAKLQATQKPKSPSPTHILRRAQPR